MAGPSANKQPQTVVQQRHAGGGLAQNMQKRKIRHAGGGLAQNMQKRTTVMQGVD